MGYLSLEHPGTVPVVLVKAPIKRPGFCLWLRDYVEALT